MTVPSPILGRFLGAAYDSSVVRLLVVDDEPRIVSFVSRALSSEGFGVDSAYDGVRALELVRSHPYALVVLDLLLPGLDGLAVLRGIMESRPEQRVLVLSALGDVESKVRCLELGASDYLVKPFALAELVARVRARLRQPNGPTAERYLRAGPVTLDLVGRTAEAGSGPVRLSEREGLLLQHLLRNEGEVCTRQQLLAEVWGFSFDPGSNVVDVYVGRLRSKLGADLIQTVRNAGYRFVAP
jgi:two-component system OmpR family response regulator